MHHTTQEIVDAQRLSINLSGRVRIDCAVGSLPKYLPIQLPRRSTECFKNFWNSANYGHVLDRKRTVHILSVLVNLTLLIVTVWTEKSSDAGQI